MAPRRSGRANLSGIANPARTLSALLSGLLRSAPPAARFKAKSQATGFRRSRKARPRPAQGLQQTGTPLVRNRTSLAWRPPDLEAALIPAALGDRTRRKSRQGPARTRRRNRRKDFTMTKTARSPRAPARVIPLRRGTTLEMVRLACPDATQVIRISESFGLGALDSDGIRELHERLVVETAVALKDGLSERAMQIHLQRIVGAYVGSAHGAGQFYSRAVTEARDATAKLSNDRRDEDLDGPVGFDSGAQRKREFAADMALQAHALRMAAEGAVSAYEQVVGEGWKPFERQIEQVGETVGRKAAEHQMAAFS